ncbi:hypothetical protein SLA2020_162550 [Shorea laevis]
MDFNPYIQTTLLLFSLLLFYRIFFRKKAARNYKSGKVGAPEPTGAWPVIGHLHMLRGPDPVCRKLGAMADKYGPIYSLKLGNYRLLVVSSWEVAKDCFTTNDRALATRPSIAAGKYLGYNNAILALAPYGDYWRYIRKMATIQLFSAHRLEELSHVRFSEVGLFIKDLFKLCNGSWVEVDMSKLLEGLTFNLILRMIVGKRFSGNNCKEDDNMAQRYMKAIKEDIELSGVFVLSDAVPWLEWMDFHQHVSRMKKTARELDSALVKWLDEHVRRRKEEKQGGRESDFMDVMLSNLPEDTVMSGHTRDIVVKATALILTLTGGESTSLSLTWVLSLLLNHPSVLKAAQEELDTVVGRDRWVEESDIKKLDLLHAIVKETLRLYPPGPVTGLREATEDCSIGGYHVPKGTRVIANIWKLHRDPRVWKNAEEFRPERFMMANSVMDFRGQNLEYMPFSYGRRSCPGMTFGLQVVNLTLARLLQGFDMAAPAGRPVDMREGLGLALPKANPLEMLLKPRLPFKLYHQCP